MHTLSASDLIDAVQGVKDPRRISWVFALFSAKEPLIIGLFYGK